MAIMALAIVGLAVLFAVLLASMLIFLLHKVPFWPNSLFLDIIIWILVVGGLTITFTAWLGTTLMPGDAAGIILAGV